MDGKRRFIWEFVSAVALLGAVFVLSFLLVRLAPGDPARAALGPMADDRRVAELRQALGLDQPLLRQLARDAGHALRGDLGRSLVSGRSVSAELIETFGFTFAVGALASAIALAGSYGFGVLAFHRPRATLLARGLRLGVSVPAFLWAVGGAIAVGALLPWVPLSGASWTPRGVMALLAPAVVASIYPTAVMASVLGERIHAIRQSQYCRTAKSLGLTASELFSRVVVRNARGVWLAAWVNQLGALVFSTMVLELIYSVPGGGPLLLRAIQSKDYPVTQGVLLLNAAFFILTTSVGRRLGPHRDLTPAGEGDVAQ